MTDKSEIPYFHEPSSAIHLRVWVLGQMVWGAFLAGVALVAIFVVLFLIWGVGLLLPPESKTAPSPYGAIEITAGATALA